METLNFGAHCEITTNWWFSMLCRQGSKNWTGQRIRKEFVRGGAFWNECI